MLIGILSDSHGRAEMVRKAVALFDRMGVDHIVHCGDVGGPPVFDELVGRPVTFVWGNMDFPEGGIHRYLETVGIDAPESAPITLHFNGKRIAVFHGHEPGFASAPRKLDVDYILHGHTHTPRDETVNGTRIVNPGALHRANPKTIATLNLATDELTFHEL